MTQEIAQWNGQSGRVYQYEVLHLHGTPWNDAPGNYIFCKVEQGRWVAVYVGQTDSFSQRLPNHEVRYCASIHGATHIHAHVHVNAGARINEEKDLIILHQPACNKQYKVA